MGLNKQRTDNTEICSEMMDQIVDGLASEIKHTGVSNVPAARLRLAFDLCKHHGVSSSPNGALGKLTDAIAEADPPIETRELEDLFNDYDE